MKIQEFDSLRQPKEVFKIKHPLEYIYSGTGRTATRKIYFRVPFDDFEDQKINELQRLLAANDIHLPSNWTRSNSLRFLYASKFELFEKDGCIDRIERHVDFLKEPFFHKLSPAAEALLNEGVIYQYGFDVLYRPVLIANPAKFDQEKCPANTLICAITTLLETVRRYAFVPGIVENWIVLVDADRLELSKDSLSLLDSVIKVLSVNYPETLEHLYVINLSKELEAMWSVIKDKISGRTLKKLTVITSENKSKLFTQVSLSQLELKFGGSLPDLKEKFWPPRKVPKLPIETPGDDYDEMISQDFGLNSLDASVISSHPISLVKLDSKNDESFSTLKNIPGKGYFNPITRKPIVSRQISTTDQGEQEQEPSAFDMIAELFGKKASSVKTISGKKRTPSPPSYDLNTDALIKHALSEYDDIRKIESKSAWKMEQFSQKSTGADSSKAWKKYLKSEPDVEENEGYGIFCGICTSRKKMPPKKERESKGWF